MANEKDIQVEIGLKTNLENFRALSKQIGGVSDTDDIQNGSSSSKGLRPGWTRATFIAKEEKVEAIRALAWYSRKTTKEIFEEMANCYFRSLGGKVKKAINEYRKHNNY